MSRIRSSRRQALGLTLVELMIAMVLGLLIVGAAVGIFVSNSQAYRATQNLGRIQETGHIAFEMMAKDIREAGANPCDVTVPVANVILTPAANWFTNWDIPLFGYDNGSLTGSAAGTDAIQILREADDAVTVESHAGTTLTVEAHSHAVGDLAMVCDHRQVALFRVASVGGTTEIGHEASGGNCSDLLGVAPATCDASATYTYLENSVVSGLRAVRWFVADNGRGGSSLFQQLGSDAAQEIAEGVSNMQITYLQPDVDAANYVDASALAITDWAGVRAVRVVLTVDGPDANAAVGGGPISRRIEHVVNLRSRNP